MADVFQSIKKNSNVVVVLSSKGKSTAIYKTAAKKFKRVLVITILHSCSRLVKEFEKHHVNCSNFFFLDLSGEALPKEEQSKQCIYIESPTALTATCITMNKIQKKFKPNLIIFDNISSLLIHNKPVTVLKFLNEIMLKVRESKHNALYFMLKGNKKMLENIGLFADDIVGA
jgi:cystathionine beta-lyase/cystathionine gamma-synthase